MKLLILVLLLTGCARPPQHVEWRDLGAKVPLERADARCRGKPGYDVCMARLGYVVGVQ